MMASAGGVKTVTLLSVKDLPSGGGVGGGGGSGVGEGGGGGGGFSLTEFCHGVSLEQWRMRQLSRDSTILQARERVLSARSFNPHSATQRSFTPHSTTQRSFTPHSMSRRSQSRSSLRSAHSPPPSGISPQRPSHNTQPVNGIDHSIRKPVDRDVVRKAEQSGEAEGNSSAGEEKEGLSPGLGQLVAVDDLDDVSTPRSASPTLSEQDCSSAGAGRGARVSDEDDLTRLENLRDGSAAHLLRSYTSLAGAVNPAQSACARSRSARSREEDGLAVSLSRQCCDVLGPRLCHQCALLQRRHRDGARHQVSLSRLHVSERNFADSITLARALPHLSRNEIEDRVAAGEILRAPLRERLYSRKARLLRDSNRSTASVRSTQSLPTDAQLLQRAGTSRFFFVNIQDLNCKLLAARWARESCGGERASVQSRRSTLTRPSSAHSSEARYSPSERTSATSHSALPPPLPPLRPLQPYEPPLVPKVCQNSEPAFFAGHQNSYRLPDRLPDQAVDGQVSDLNCLNAAWSAGAEEAQVLAEEVQS